MARADLTAASVLLADAEDIQGILRSGYGDLAAARFLVLGIKDAASARAWLRTAPVTTAAHLKNRVTRALHVAFTASGLRELKVPADIVEGFSPEFCSGMAGDAARSRRLGDIDGNHPDCWSWGGPRTHVPHMLLMLYAVDQDLDRFCNDIRTPRWDAAFFTITTLDTTGALGAEPFGFADGISQPSLDWGCQRVPGGPADGDYGNTLALGEFLLGYRNEYGQYTDRPQLNATQDPRQLLAPSEEDARLRDPARNGSYLVLRDLRQDVVGFWRTLAKLAGPRPEDIELLACALVGRTRGGEPLLPMEQRPIRGVDRNALDRKHNQFTFAADPDGLACPYGAHVRRANPRTGDLPRGRRGPIGRLIAAAGFASRHVRDDLVASSRFHRILRRGRQFGIQVTPEEALAGNCPDGDRGLYFIGLNANIARQFEFIQHAWMMASTFNGLQGETDPLLGTRKALPGSHPTDAFTLQRAQGPARCVAGLPAFITVRGGAYFFLPGLRMLRFLSAGEQPHWGHST